MSKINRHPVRRTAAGVLASALVLSGAVAAATPASAAAGFGFDRLAGNDRYETSAAISARYRAVAGTTAITNVILASGESGRTPDALAASFLAGVQNAPVLVTRRDTTPEPILAELRNLRTAGATTLTIVGGPVAISEQQLTTLRGLGFTTINRLAGANRFETARAIVAAGESAAASNVGLVASGVSTIDALAGGPLAYKGKHPLFLVTRNGIPAATLAAMREAGVTSVYILGGEAVVGPQVVAQLARAGVTVTGRLAGADRSATSVAIAEALIANFGFDRTTFNLASGTNEGIDALSGAALSGRENRPILISNTLNSAAPVVAFAQRNAASLTAVGHIFGGVAVISQALQTQITTAGGGTGAVAGEGQVTLVASTVQQGGTISGTVGGVNNRSVTVSGCGFTNAPVAIGPFSLVIPASQAVGTCTLTFTVTNNQGVVTTQTQTVTVQAATVVQGTGTVRPELASATIVQTLAGTGTTIRYTFDEALTGASIAAVDAPSFAVYRFGATVAADRIAATSVRVDESDNRSVLATFAGFTAATGTGAESAAQLAVAVVDEGAVTDLQNQFNPIGDAALNPGAVTTPALTGGVTAAPDLVTVGNFRANAADANTTLVDFTFDEAADRDATTTGNYLLVSTDGITVRTGTVVAGSGTTVHTVRFDNAAPGATLPSTVALTAAGQARGVVEANTVNETASGNAANPRQAADVTAGTTETPDLVSASIVRDATTAAGTRDQILFTFDEPVVVGTGDFVAYLTNGTQLTGANPVRSTANAAQVLVDFGAAANALDLAVGAGVGTDAVAEAAGTTRGNEVDEEALSNPGAPASTTVSGRTDGPDLIAVAVERTTNQFGTTTGGQVRYTFDEDVFSATDATRFSLVEADGTIRRGVGAGTVGTTEDTDNQVVVTFGADVTTEAILRSVLGTVDDGAVVGQASGTGATAVTGTDRNPEGAQLATGTTGTPSV